MITEELRDSFLVQGLFQSGKTTFRFIDLDRVVLGGVVPTDSSIDLPSPPQLGTETFAERREIGVLNIGGAGTIVVDRVGYAMSPLDLVYIGRGVREVSFESERAGEPARYYLVSYPAHAAYPTVHLGQEDAEVAELGTEAQANRRKLYKYVRPGGVTSAQLVMGVTVLEEGSVWNTMPAHTHSRRTEVYLYFGMDDDSAVFHLMGEPLEVRTIVVRGEEAILSPGWSIHSGAGTGAYSFCWSMGGENQDFGDMQFVGMGELK